LGAGVDALNLTRQGAGPLLRADPEVAVPINVAQDRERAVLLDLIGHRDRKGGRQVERQVIERRAEALEAVSDEERDVCAWERLGRVDPGTRCARFLGIGLLSDGLLCAFAPGFGQVSGFFEVVLCP
jgi:hypothetical protein